MSQLSRPEQLPTAETYVGLYGVPGHEQQPLLERMGAYELEVLLANTNSELKCLTLGATEEVPSSTEKIYQRLAEAGAFQIERLGAADLTSKFKDYSPGLFTRTEEGEIGLTPFGVTAKGFAGNLLEVGLKKNVRLGALLGTKKLGTMQRITECEDQPTFGQTTRLLAALAISQLGNGGRVAVDVYRQVSKPQEVSKSMFDGQIASLARAGLIETCKGKRGRLVVSPTELLRDVRAELAVVLEPTINRDPDVAQRGLEAMHRIMNGPDLAMLVRRSFVESDNIIRPRRDSVVKVVYELLEDGCKTTRELFDGAKDAGHIDECMSFDAFRSALYAVDKYNVSLPVERVKNGGHSGKGMSVFWQRTETCRVPLRTVFR